MKVYKMNNGGEWIRFSDGSMVYYPPLREKSKQVKRTFKIKKHNNQ